MSSTAAMPTARYDLDQSALSELFADLPAFRGRQIWDGLYRRALDPSDMTDLSKSLRQRVADTLPQSLVPAAEAVAKNGQTIKWLWQLADGAEIETVLMKYPDRATVCVSTQAGFQRHLRVGEIVEQVVRAVQRARPRRVSNVVFMGMGEPLANYDATWKAAERIHDDLAISARHITISTVGLVPGIRRLTQEALPVNLAVSLHAANDRLRDELVPINRRYPLADLMAACHDYRRVKRRRISLEWAMIEGVNDRDQDAHELAGLATPLRAHVNLIPLNPTSGYTTGATSREHVEGFAAILHRAGVPATIRENRGLDIDAACGQLRIRTNRDPQP